MELESLDNVACAVGDQESDALVVDAAAALAGRLHAGLLLVHVFRRPYALTGVSPYAIPLDAVEVTRPASEHAARMLDELAERVPDGVRVRPVARDGEVVDQVLAVARGEGAGLIVCGGGAHGPLRDAVAGSVSARLASESEIPVVVVPAHGGPACAAAVSRRGAPVLLGVDGSGPAQRAAACAGVIAQRLSAPVRVAHVIEQNGGVGSASTLDLANDGIFSAREIDRGLGIVDGACERIAGHAEPSVALTRGEPAPELARIAEEIDAAFVAVGARGHGALRAALFGSTSRELVRTATRPVLVVPPAHGARER